MYWNGERVSKKIVIKIQSFPKENTNLFRFETARDILSDEARLSETPGKTNSETTDASSFQGAQDRQTPERSGSLVLALPRED